MDNFCNSSNATDAPKNQDVQSLGISTVLVHADDHIESTPDIAPPIHVSTTFFEDNEQGLVYSRAEQPTRSYELTFFVCSLVFWFTF